MGLSFRKAPFPFSAKKNYQPFLNSLKAKVENPLYLISKSIQDTENFIKENFEKIEAAKKEYFTQELKLTDKEAEKFWPVHDEFSKADRENRKKQRNFKIKRQKNNDN